MRSLYALFFFCVTSYASESGLTLHETVKELDPTIEGVFLCGRWEHGINKGAFRIVHGFLWSHGELYVQWVADSIFYPKKGQEERPLPVVIATADFPMNDYHADQKLENIRCVKRKNGWYVLADAINMHEEKESKAKYRIEVRLFDQPGKSEYKELARSNPAFKRDALKRAP